MTVTAIFPWGRHVGSSSHCNDGHIPCRLPACPMHVLQDQPSCLSASTSARLPQQGTALAPPPEQRYIRGEGAGRSRPRLKGGVGLTHLAELVTNARGVGAAMQVPRAPGWSAAAAAGVPYTAQAVPAVGAPEGLLRPG